MDAILIFFSDDMVVGSLVITIAIIVVMLLLYTQKSPETVVKAELGSTEKVEGALRRVLGEQSWASAGAGANLSSTGDGQNSSDLEAEVLEKDRKIAELNKQLTQAGPSTGGAGGDDQALLAKINELEARLQEYEIIEDDIADLSLYKTENDKLKEQIEKLKAGLSGGSGAAEPAPTPAPEGPNEDNVLAIDNDDHDSSQGSDLVAEFEKVVNNQEQTSPAEPSSRVSIKGDIPEGKVLMADELGGKKEMKNEPLPIHPKLSKVNPDSKEEAEVFIAELKSLKSIKKGSEE